MAYARHSREDYEPINFSDFQRGKDSNDVLLG